MRLSRRSLLLAALLAASPAAAQIAPGTPFSSVSVDVSHLRAIGLGPPFTDIIQGAMTDELYGVYRDRIQRGAPHRLVVRVTGLFLTTLPEGGSWRWGGGRGTSTDSIDGEALILDRGGRVVARYPQHNALVPQGAWYDPLDEQKRAERVARNYAQWLRRYTVP